MTGAAVHMSALWFQLLVLLALFATSNTTLIRAEDTITEDRPFSGDAKLVSRGGKFALGLFKPDGAAPGRWYVGIWYNNIPVRTPVWVANREQPVSDPAASRLTIAADGNLVLLDASGTLAWSTNASAAVEKTANSNATVAAVLLDTGNLVLVPSSNASDVLWQSFDYIGETWLPGVKLRLDKVYNCTQGMTSWRARGDPTPGAYTFQVKLNQDGEPKYMLWSDDESKYWTSQALDVVMSGGGAGYTFRFVDNDQESYFTYGFTDNSTVYRFVMDVSGQLKGWLWEEATRAWKLVYVEPKALCDVPRGCGSFGVCSRATASPDACGCARGFHPRDVVRWNLGDYTDGCVRNAELQCHNNRGLKAEDIFLRMLNMRLPEQEGRLAAGDSSLADCKRACLYDCTCSAFSYAYGLSCIMWYNDLQNLQDDYPIDAGNLYLRLAASELLDTRRKPSTVNIVLVGTLSIVFFVVVASVCATMAQWRATKVQCLAIVEGYVASFTYHDLQSFTKNFSDKLGGGAFGSVFKGQLPGQTAIAVKKLQGLRQGEKQFRAEVSTLGTIHHINLIRLLGFCSNEKLLVYEYMSNGSLDRHLFSATTLSWRARYRIAIGVAKGLSYLHDKCRHRIIHCDIKPENILLDADFMPKVADFGLAKLVGRDFSRVLTTMRGTVGYLTPEWISGEPVTAKADVYSYGMMLFEIVSGKRNAEHGNTESGPELSSGGSEHAAAEFFPVLVARKLVDAEGDVKALLDPALGGDADYEEVTRMCKVACWCIQDKVDTRPTMAEVVLVLEGVTEAEVPPVPRYLEMLVGRWMHATQDYSSWMMPIAKSVCDSEDYC